MRTSPQQGKWPVISAIVILALGLVVATATAICEGFHSGVPWILFLSILYVFMIGVLLGRTQWKILAVASLLLEICLPWAILAHYYSRIPDWMDANPPQWLLPTTRVLHLLFFATIITCGTMGWRTFRENAAQQAGGADGTPEAGAPSAHP
jgi:hypothetical protein